MVNLRNCREFDRKHLPKSAAEHFSISTPRVFMTKEIADSQPNFSAFSVDQKLKNKKVLALKKSKNIKNGMKVGM